MDPIIKSQFLNLLQRYQDNIVIEETDTVDSVKTKIENMLDVVISDIKISSYSNIRVKYMNGAYRCKFDVVSTEGIRVSVVTKLSN